jgi:hypothetical protein
MDLVLSNSKISEARGQTKKLGSYINNFLLP